MEIQQQTQQPVLFVQLEQLQQLDRPSALPVLQGRVQRICKVRQHALHVLQAPIQHRELQHALHVQLDQRVGQQAQLAVLLVMLGRSHLELEIQFARFVQMDTSPHPLGYLNVHRVLLGHMDLLQGLLYALLAPHQDKGFRHTLLRMGSLHALPVSPV